VNVGKKCSSLKTLITVPIAENSLKKMIEFVGEQKMKNKAIVKEGPDRVISGHIVSTWQVILVGSIPSIMLTEFLGCDDESWMHYGYLSTEIAPLVAGDYAEIFNDKYVDKEINKEWGKIYRYERMVYHIEQLQLLTSDKKLHWNEHGTGVE
jgi:hypothetical protein